MKDKKKFRSRISLFLAGFILAIILPLFINACLNKSYQEMYTLGGALLFIILLFSGMRYVIAGEKLYLKMWFIPNGSKNIADIVSIKRSYNPLSSPAGSLKRLSIRFKTSNVTWLISPANEQEFIETLKAINPDINVQVPVFSGTWRIWDWDI